MFQISGFVDNVVILVSVWTLAASSVVRFVHITRPNQSRTCSYNAVRKFDLQTFPCVLPRYLVLFERINYHPKITDKFNSQPTYTYMGTVIVYSKIFCMQFDLKIFPCVSNLPTNQ